MSDVSEAAGALVNGPESRYVVRALDALLEGDADGARRILDEAAGATGWAAVSHRIDVAGKALARDEEIVECAEDLQAEVDEAESEGEAGALGAVLAAWLRGDGLPVTVDLTSGTVDLEAPDDRCWAGLSVLATLVERCGFPPQVVA